MTHTHSHSKKVLPNQPYAHIANIINHIMGHPPQPTLIHPILLPQPFSSSPTAPAYSSIRHIIMKMLELRMRCSWRCSWCRG